MLSENELYKIADEMVSELFPQPEGWQRDIARAKIMLALRMGELGSIENGKDQIVIFNYLDNVKSGRKLNDQEFEHLLEIARKL